MWIFKILSFKKIFSNLRVLKYISICVLDKAASNSSIFLAFFCLDVWSPGHNRALSTSHLWASQGNLYWWWSKQKLIGSVSRRIQSTQGLLSSFRLWWASGASFHWCQFQRSPRCWILPEFHSSKTTPSHRQAEIQTQASWSIICWSRNHQEAKILD